MKISGQCLILVSGVAQPLESNTTVNKPVAIKALETNTHYVVIGNDGNNDVDFSSGFMLTPGELVVFEYVGDMDDLYLYGEIAGEGICWLSLDL